MEASPGDYLPLCTLAQRQSVYTTIVCVIKEQHLLHQVAILGVYKQWTGSVDWITGLLDWPVNFLLWIMMIQT